MRLKHLIYILAAAFWGAKESCGADRYYVDPNSTPAIWARNHPKDQRATKIAASIVNAPLARWFGNWSGDVRLAVQEFVGAADAVDSVPILVVYNIPDRDCGGQSAGGAVDAASYLVWIEAFSQGVNTRKAIVIVEPDSIAQVECLKTTERREARLTLLHAAVSRIRLNAPAADVYLDAGNAHWVPAAAMAMRLNQAGLSEVKGFALNVSNFYSTVESIAYAAELNDSLMHRFGYSKAAVIDTSRNGNGSNGQWCNPAHAKLGDRTGVISDQIMCAWIKVPGNSDGACGVAPSTRAGSFDPDLAIRLIDGN